MGDSVTPEILGNMIRQYFSQERAEEETIQALNHLRRVLHEVSPFAQEPVDCVLWVKADEVVLTITIPMSWHRGRKTAETFTGAGWVHAACGGFGREGALSGRGWFSSSVAGQGSRYGKTPERLVASGLY